MRMTLEVAVVGRRYVHFRDICASTEIVAISCTDVWGRKMNTLGFAVTYIITTEMNLTYIG